MAQRRVLLLSCRSRARVTFNTGYQMMIRIQKDSKGQNLVEYAIIVGLVAAAMLAMSTYVFRSVQATQKVIQEGYAD